MTRFVFFIVMVFLIVTTLVWQSEVKRHQADSLLAQGKANEAIATYQLAQKLFPLRTDLAAAIAGARLVAESAADYAQIGQFMGEMQTAPNLNRLPKVTLKENEVFVPILMYHHIRVNPRPSDPIWAALNVSPDQLEQQLYYLNSHGFRSITLDELTQSLQSKIPLPTKPIVLTFDDGYRNFYTTAFPLLKKYDIKAVQFVITQVVDNAQYLTWDEIKEMDRSGLIQFGAHTQHHLNLPDFDNAIIAQEIRGSKTDLESHLGKPISWFAYPYGSYNNFAIQTVKDAGFKGAVSTIYGVAQSQETVYLAPRIMINGRFTLDNISYRIEQ